MTQALRPLHELGAAEACSLVGIFCDIDDTLTTNGRLVPEAFVALQRAHDAGLRVVPITGRPAGWVDHIARMWPVDGVVGENGGLWFYMAADGLRRRFIQDPISRAAHRVQLDALATEILSAVPGCAVASDQPYRALDLAIDFCEDVEPLSDEAVARIVAAFEAAGATAKVSSIHVNGWFGRFDKLTGCTRFLQERWSTPLEEATDTWMFVGDSPNDAPMFGAFTTSIGVANVRPQLHWMTERPRYVTPSEGGLGFAEAVDHVLALRAG